QQLQRGHALAALDTGDVDGAAARERELPLAQPGALPGLLQPLAEGDRVVDVRPVTLRHQNLLLQIALVLYTPVNTRGPGELSIHTERTDPHAASLRDVRVGPRPDVVGRVPRRRPDLAVLKRKRSELAVGRPARPSGAPMSLQNLPLSPLIAP